MPIVPGHKPPVREISYWHGYIIKSVASRLATEAFPRMETAFVRIAATGLFVRHVAANSIRRSQPVTAQFPRVQPAGARQQTEVRKAQS